MSDRLSHETQLVQDNISKIGRRVELKATWSIEHSTLTTDKQQPAIIMATITISDGEQTQARLKNINEIIDRFPYSNQVVD